METIEPTAAEIATAEASRLAANVPSNAPGTPETYRKFLAYAKAADAADALNTEEAFRMRSPRRKTT